MSVTDFGADGPRAHWRATDPVLYAMSTALSRSGPTTGRPGAAAGRHRLGDRRGTGRVGRTGRATTTDYVTAQAITSTSPASRRWCSRLDPPFGSEGQAAAGQKQSDRAVARQAAESADLPDLRRAGTATSGSACSRRASGAACGRGWASPSSSQDPKFDTIAARYAASSEINALIGELFATQTMDGAGDRRARRRGVPIAAVLQPGRGAGLRALPVGRRAHRASRSPRASTCTVPVGRVRRRRAPRRVQPGRRHSRAPTKRPGAQHDPPASAGRLPPRRHRPFEGLRILDLGVIVAGGELGRLFADLGAEVIKVESATYPDGLRQTPPGSR